MGARTAFEVERMIANAAGAGSEPVPEWDRLSLSMRLLVIAVYYRGCNEGVERLAANVKAAREAGPHG